MRRPTLALLALASLAPAQDLPKQARDRHEYDLVDVAWSLSFDLDKGAIQGDVTNTVTATKDAPLLVFDCARLTVESVRLDGRPIAFKADGRVLAVVSDAKKGATRKVEIVYRGLPEAGVYFVPAARAFPAKTPVVYTQGEMEDTRYWLPTYDSPDDKATSHGTITVPAGWNVLGNGSLVAMDNSTYRWTMDQPHSTYLISFVAGPYTEVPDGTGDRKGKVPFSIWTPQGLEKWGVNAFRDTGAIARWYAMILDTPYPWSKYAQSAVPDFMFGGMENVTATTQSLGALYPDEVRPTQDGTELAAHELAHQWFGDLVTTPRWDDVWINEGWATFMAAYYGMAKVGPSSASLDRYDVLEGAKEAMREAPSRSMVWSGWKDPIDVFDGYAYAGGAARMFALMNKLGEMRFWKATQAYLAEYAGKNVDTAGFFASFSKSTGVDLSTFERQWFRTPSVPPRIEARRVGGKVVLRQTQPVLFSLDLDVWVLRRRLVWLRKRVTMTGREATLDLSGEEIGDGPVLVDPQAYLPIDVAYPDATLEDLKAMWDSAIIPAAKLRLADALMPRLTPDERDALVMAENDERFQARLMRYSTGPDALVAMSKGMPRATRAALGRMGEVPATEATKARLREVWTDEAAEPDLRLAALGSLYTLTKDATLVDAASKMDRYDDGYRVWALAQREESNPEKARGVALAALKNGTEPLRLAAIRTLGRLKDLPGHHDVYDALAAMMAERSNSPLRAAIAALADYGDPSAIPLLEKRKDHSLVFVRQDVAEALVRLKDGESDAKRVGGGDRTAVSRCRKHREGT